MDSIFPILAVFIDKRTKWIKGTVLANVHVLYSESTISITKNEEKRERNELKLNELLLRVDKLKKLLVKTFSEHCNFGLFAPKFKVLFFTSLGRRVVRT